MFRIASFAAHRLSLAYTNDAQARLQDLRVQVASGKKSQDYAGLAGEARRLVSLESSHARTQGFVGSIERTDRRLQTMETATSSLFDVATRARSLIIGALNADNSKAGDLTARFARLREQAVGLLNASLDGRYFFAGARTETAPVDPATFDPTDPAYSADDPANGGYYRGDDTILSVRADTDLTIDYGVTAADPAFDKLMQALELVRTAPPAAEGLDRARLESALALAKQATEEIPDVQARIGTTRTMLEQTKAAHGDRQLYAEQAIGDIENVDVTAAMTRISADQTQLQASFAVTARLSQLSLIDFLR